MKIKENQYFLFLCALFISLRFVWLGDMSFLGDEAMLLHQALEANEAGVWAEIGLKGSKGTFYGPLATWIYQVLLKITHNMDLLILLKILLESALQFLGVMELRKHFPRWPAFVFLLIFMSPYFFFYSRMFWDNPFNVSFSMLLFTGVMSFVRAPSFILLLRTAVLAAFCLSIHLMSGSLLLALALWMLWIQGRYLLTKWYQVFISLAAALLILWPYVGFLLENSPSGSQTHAFAFVLKSLGGALLGTRLLTGLGLNYFYGYEFDFLELMAMYALGALGLVLLLAFFWAFVGMWRSFFQPQKQWSLDQDANGLSISLFLRIFFVVHILFCLATNLFHHPHYYNASWVPYWILTAYGLLIFKESSLYWLKKFMKIFEPIYMSTACLCLLNILLVVHVHDGSRRHHYGPTLAQMRSVVASMIDLRTHPDLMRFNPVSLSDLSKSIHFLYRLQVGTAKLDLSSFKKSELSYRDPENKKKSTLKVALVE